MLKNMMIAIAQIDVALYDTDVNLATIRKCVAKAKAEKNAQIIVFPELSNIGYIKNRDKNFGGRYIDNAEKIPGPFTDELCQLAAENEIMIICGMTELHPDIPATLYNSAVVITPSGQIAGKHRKIHIPGYEKFYFVPANTNQIIRTDMANIGVGICYDNQFCEYTRALAVQGADFLVMLWNMPSFSNEPEMLYRLTSTRAFENRFYVISCNRIGENNGIEFFGHSCIADPLGNLIAQAGTEETIIYAEINRDRILEERAQMSIFRDRRPDLYSDLVKPL